MFIDGEVKRYEECSFEEWKTFLTDRIQHWVSVYYISGGEPALYKDIVPLTNWLIERGHHVIIMTNLSYPKNFKGIKPHWRLMFQPTFHPKFAKLDVFRRNLDELRRLGFNVTSQQVLQNDGNFSRIKEFFTVNWFKNIDNNLQAAPDSPKTLRLYTGCVNVFRKDENV
jgi:organic radical activating enzyme